MNLSKPRIVLILFLTVPVLWAGTAVDDGADQVKILKEAGIAADGPSLIKYFQTRTPSPGDQARYAELVRALGDKSFSVREKATRDLIAIGEPVLPFLKKALKDGDLEMTRRAAGCIRAIERVPFSNLTAAAAHLLTLRRPDGAAEVLLAYLPFADWDAVGENLLESLGSVNTNPSLATFRSISENMCWASLGMPASVHAMGVESLGAAAVCGVARARANCDAGAGVDIQPSSDFVRKYSELQADQPAIRRRHADRSSGRIHLVSLFFLN